MMAPHFLVKTELKSLVDPVEGSGGPRPPSFLDQTEKTENFFGDRPPPPLPYLRVWMIAAPFAQGLDHAR